MGWMVSFTLLHVYLWRKSPWYLSRRRFSGSESRSGRFREGINLLPPPTSSSRAIEPRFLRCPVRSWIITKTEQFRLLNIWYTVMNWQNTAYTYWIRADEDCAGFEWILTPGVSLPHLVLVLCRQICIFRAAFFVALCVQLSLLCKNYRTKLFNCL
jgi:hypothetical protein